MSNILVLSSYCFEKASTNGLCALALAKAFKSSNDNVTLVGYGDKTGYIYNQQVDYAYTIKNSKEGYSNTKQIKFVKKLYNVGCTFIRPELNKDLINNYYTEVCKIIEEKNIDVLVAMYYPAELICIASKLKDRYPTIKIIFYELDSAYDGIIRDGFVAKMQIKGHIRWLKQQYKKTDIICIMESHYKKFIEIFGNKYQNKLCKVDLPVLQEHTCIENVEVKKNSFLYAGILDKNYRSPRKILEIFCNIKGYDLNLYTKGNCEDQIAECCKAYNNIHQYGYVTKEELNIAIQKVRCLISIGNTNSNSVPSKIIDYISFGKPIIHFSLKDNDICNDYLSRYPLALVIDRDKNIDESIKLIMEFMRKIEGKRVSYNEIKELFIENTPSFSVKIIKEKI